jgi:hypothetical protein
VHEFILVVFHDRCLFLLFLLYGFFVALLAEDVLLIYAQSQLVAYFDGGSLHRLRLVVLFSEDAE